MQNAFGDLKKYNSTLLFFPFELEYKKPFGAVSTHQKVDIRFPVKDKFFVKRVEMVIRNQNNSKRIVLSYNGKNEDNEDYSDFIGNFVINKAGNYYYRFEIFLKNSILFVGRDENGQAIIGDNLPEWHLTVYNDGYTTPKTFCGGVVYQIFVDRFCKGGNKIIQPNYGVLKNWDEEVTIVDSDGIYRANDFYGGNLAGIIEKLDYLQNLGVTCLYLSPIFESNSNHRYDTADYTKIDKLLGDEENFKLLIAKAKEKGITIMLDGVFNHTGADSKYFNKFGHYKSIGAYNSCDSVYYDWYTFTNYPNKYDCWWGITVVPTIKRNCESFQEMIAGTDGVIEKWLKLGVGGWRLDVVDELSEKFVKKIRNRIKENNKEAVLIGEVWEDASKKFSYGEEREYFQGNELDGVMNYMFKKAILDYVIKGNATNFINQTMDIINNYPKQSMDTCMSLIDSHDTARAINALLDINEKNMNKQQKLDYILTEQQYNEGKARLKIASCLQYFLPGVPSLYYGDEIGMCGFDDPINRRPFMWNNIDEDLLGHYRILGNLRKQYKANFCGNIKITCLKNMIKIDRDGIFLIVNVNKGHSLDREYYDILSKKNVDALDRYQFIISTNM
ncbi:MAG: glycoside hydrolase family 13 protein [Clostridia bacterium]